MNESGEILDVKSELFNPEIPIELRAMAVHHITEKMVIEKPRFEDSKIYEKLKELSKTHIFVAHNAAFDLEILKQYDIKPDFHICTMKVAQHLLDLECYKLQYLRYYFNIDIEANAHDALGDVKVLFYVFDKLLTMPEMTILGTTPKDRIFKMFKLTNQPILLKKIPFGKYVNKLFKDIANDDISYLRWMSEKMENKSPDLIYTLLHYLQ
jgi:exodeoxyribonuclease X